MAAKGEVNDVQPLSEGNPPMGDGNSKLNDSCKHLSKALRRQYLVKGLPEAVKSRIVILKNIQLDCMKLSADFDKEIYELQKKYNKLTQPLKEKRTDIINGVLEPPKQLPQYKENKYNGDNKPHYDFTGLLEKYKAVPANAKGVPAFWLTVFKTVWTLDKMIQPHDEDALLNLYDVKVCENYNWFIIEFKFHKNKYFANEKLTKRYSFCTELDEFENPFNYDGPKVRNIEGCKIEWKPDMDLTVKINEKDQTQIPKESFFNFFNPPTLEEADDNFKINLNYIDVMIGQYFRTDIIPNAVLFFTGDRIAADAFEDVEEDWYTDESDDEEESASLEKNKMNNKITKCVCS